MTTDNAWTPERIKRELALCEAVTPGARHANEAAWEKALREIEARGREIERLQARVADLTDVADARLLSFCEAHERIERLEGLLRECLEMLPTQYWAKDQKALAAKIRAELGSGS